MPTATAAVAPAPDAPTDFAAVSSWVVGGRIDLTWTDASSDETGFSIEQSANGTTGWAEVATPAADATAASITGLANNTTFYFRIRALNGGSPSDYSDVANAKTTAQTDAPFTNFYHTTEDAVGALTYDSVDYSRDVAYALIASVANWIGYAWKMAGTGFRVSMSLEVLIGGSGRLYDNCYTEYQLHEDGTFAIKESGVQKATGNYTASEELRLMKVSGVVYYVKAGVIVWTSLVDPTLLVYWKFCMNYDPAAQTWSTYGYAVSQN